MQRRVAFVLGGLLVLSAGTLSACSYTNNDRLNAVRDDPTPNVDTLYQRSEDIDNKMVVTFDENGRSFWEDMGRVWLTDHPSKLTREPHPHP